MSRLVFFRSVWLVGLLVLLPLAVVAVRGCRSASQRTLINVSYDTAREFYKAYDVYFIAEWEKRHGEKLTIDQQHGGSGAQARKVLSGQEADVVTLALGYDIDMLATRGDLINADWQTRLPHNSSPYTSTIVMMVRAGNPKGIRDWDDLTRDGLEVITPNPRTAGGARWNYLAVWGYALKRELGDLTLLRDAETGDAAAKETVAAAQAKAREFVAAIYKNVKIMDDGARGSTKRFVENSQGDVFITWEYEAFHSQEMRPGDKLEIVVPSCSILCEPPVAVVDALVDRRQTRDLAEAYLRELYERPAQEIIAQHHYRPIDPAVLAANANRFLSLELFSIGDVFGGWTRAQHEHFDTGGRFDQIQWSLKK